MNKQQKAVAVAGGVVVAVWWYTRGAGSSAPGGLVPSVTTSEGFDMSPYGGATSYSEPIQRMAKAIAKQEGFYTPGSIPQRANNPGDLKAGPPYLVGTSITQYSSVDAGFQALHRQLHLILTGRSSYYNLDMTIADMARVWTATQQGAWASNVSSFLGVPTTTPLYDVLA